ncbi:VOC family protein [Rhodococcus sp. NPDC058521]|uniref:VOC family protein n=1 Tax=Rhodococcus sp. NPDC058521 TaxID=3346536 RepID=UPI00365B61AA
MTNTHHTLNYIEIPVDDMESARAFYRDAFGWTFNDYGPEYSGIRAADGDGEVGGLSGVGGTPRAGGVLVLLYSDDLDASVAGVDSAGGRILQAPYTFPGGRRFRFTDPSGNELGVWATS